MKCEEVFESLYVASIISVYLIEKQITILETSCMDRYE